MESIKLDVYFDNGYEYDSQAMLVESLTTGEVKLILKYNLFINETRYFIDKATELLNKRYKEVNVDIHWDSLKINKEKEGNKNE